jgi:hypothetical protein
VLWLQDPNKSNADNVNHISRERSRLFKNKTGYVNGKVNTLQTNNNNKNVRDLYRGISLQGSLRSGNAKNGCQSTWRGIPKALIFYIHKTWRHSV